jgi:hypothetical protein
MHLLPVCLPVEQTETHLLAVCQSWWTDLNAPIGSLSVLMNRLKCTYWQTVNPDEQTEMHLLAVCQSCWIDWNARVVDLGPHFMRFHDRDQRHIQDYRSFVYKELIFCIIRYSFSLIPSSLSKYIVTSLVGFYPSTGLSNKCSTLTWQTFQRLKWRSGAINLTW